MAVYPKAPGNTIVKKNVSAKKRVLTAPNRVPDLASPGTARTTKPVSSNNSNGPKGGSGKSSVPANRTYLKTGKTKPPAPKVTKAKLNSGVKATPFNRSSRVNYRQLRRSK